jgi:molybdopterin-guanine dinucleotide biosynthesis protein A
MGGANKPLLPLNGTPLVSHVLDRLSPQVGTVIISANRDLESYHAFGHPVIADETPGLGPLGGLASVAPQVTTPWIFCCPGDAPRLASDLVARLGSACDEHCEAAYPHDGERPQYLFLLVRTAACTDIAAHLRDGGRSVHGWLDAVRARAVAMSVITGSFANVNSSHTLAELGTDN